MSLNFVKAEWITARKKWASLVISDGHNIDDSYGLDNNGTIVKVGAAEGALLIEDNGTVELGQGHHTNTGSKRYGGDWEGY
jgi:hypothetical protein